MHPPAELCHRGRGESRAAGSGLWAKTLTVSIWSTPMPSTSLPMSRRVRAGRGLSRSWARMAIRRAWSMEIVRTDCPFGATADYSSWPLLNFTCPGSTRVGTGGPVLAESDYPSLGHMTEDRGTCQSTFSPPSPSPRSLKALLPGEFVLSWSGTCMAGPED